MSGSEGRCERECSGGEGLLGGDGEVDRPVGGRGAADRDPGGRSADLPSEPPAGPSVWKTERQCLSAALLKALAWATALRKTVSL